MTPRKLAALFDIHLSYQKKLNGVEDEESISNPEQIVDKNALALQQINKIGLSW